IEIVISFHIRRGDNVTHPKKFGRPYLWATDYYKNSISYFEEKFGLDKIRFIVISSNSNWSKDFMKKEFPKYKVTFPSEKDYLELYIMSICKHQIIASSTFSWWAAYLNENPEKIVIAPKNWHDPRRVPNWEWRYMDDWIRL
ncbi:MAG: alpha-1,2-fucosyltransferase, partial [Candidatus Thorarchaeota archaeon]